LYDYLDYHSLQTAQREDTIASLSRRLEEALRRESGLRDAAAEAEDAVASAEAALADSETRSVPCLTTCSGPAPFNSPHTETASSAGATTPCTRTHRCDELETEVSALRSAMGRLREVEQNLQAARRQFAEQHAALAAEHAEEVPTVCVVGPYDSGARISTAEAYYGRVCRVLLGLARAPAYHSVLYSTAYYCISIPYCTESVLCRLGSFLVRPKCVVLD
jgi:hypothetical protein